MSEKTGSQDLFVLKLGDTNSIRVPRPGNAQWGVACFRAVAVLLVALFVFAALHEVVYVLLGHEHEHDHETFPFCLLIHTPVLLGLCAVLIIRLFLRRATPLAPHDVPATRLFALRPDPRAPPLS